MRALLYLVPAGILAWWVRLGVRLSRAAAAWRAREAVSWERQVNLAVDDLTPDGRERLRNRLNVEHDWPALNGVTVAGGISTVGSLRGATGTATFR